MRHRMAKRTDQNIGISKKIKETETYMKERVGLDVSFDIGFREIYVLEEAVQLYYVNGLVDDATVVEIIKVLVSINDNEVESKKLYEIVKNRLVNQQVDPVQTMDEAVDAILSGLIVVFINGEKYALVVDVRRYPGRGPEEPDTERVIRGSRDGYTENVIENTALTRRRIRDARLRHEMLKVGERSKTDVCVSYIQDVADDDLVQFAKKRIKQIEIDGLTMTDKALEEFIIGRSWNPYPIVRYTERPDVAATHLLEGHVIIMVDTSPSVIILPTTFFDHLEHAEEFRQTPTVGTFIRWIRLLAVIASLFLLPLWLLYVLEPTLVPKSLSFIGPNEEGNIPIVIQIILAILGVEFLRLAAIHTPTALATALGLIAAVLIGEIAIEVGMLSPEVILYVAISTVGFYVTSSYELSVANRIMNVLFIIVTALFGVIGFTVSVLLYTLFLIQLKTLKTPYFWPFIPFDAKAMYHFLVRIPVPFEEKRPSFVHPKNDYRQPKKR